MSKYNDNDMTDEEIDAYLDSIEEFYDTGDDVYNELTGEYPPLYFERDEE